MIPFEKAYEEVSELVRKFDEHKDQFMAHNYQEAHVRIEFLDGFWTALGWDVRHSLQTNPREQEVKIEKSDTAGSTRRVDYAFRLKPDYKNTVFFCEAKKPSIDLANPDDYFQLVRYGYGAGTPVGVLTNFDEFHVIDCRYQPHIEKSYPSAQIKVFGYKDYLDKESFGFIYWLFSREAIAAGELKKYAAGLPKQRGTGKTKLTAEEAKPVDEAFLIKLEEYRRILAKAFKKADESLTAEVLTEATQKVIDRLVFIRFLEDKYIEADYIVDQIAAKKGGSWKSFLAWSKELDVKYNGVVFKPHDIDKPTFAAPDDKVFAELCLDISHSKSKYLFTYIPIELLGSIYERFLGKVVTTTAKRAEIEDKPEVRKAGGVYYTPKYIVDYIVENTVGKILRSGAVPAPTLSNGRHGAGEEASEGWGTQPLQLLAPKEISKLRFADIACGSGSFLIAVYDTVLHHVEKYYNDNPDEARKAKCNEIEKGIFVLSLKQKQQILLDNIFGVDIDRQAVEVAQLSLFLKLLESESGATAEQLSFERTKILPDLSKNIQCGNSLVEYDISDLFPLTPQEEMKIKPFSFSQAFKPIMDAGGFDAIVGNPPYVRIQILNEYKPSEVKYYGKKYLTATKGNYDVYVLFSERAIQLINRNGEIGYIVPSKFTTSDYGQPLRTLLSKNSQVRKFVNFGHEQVFKGATTYTCLLFMNKDSHEKIEVVDVTDFAKFQRQENGLTSTLAAIRLNSIAWSFETGSKAELMDKLRDSHPSLGELADIFVGLQTSADNVYILDLVEEKAKEMVLYSKSLERQVTMEKGLLHPLLSGKDIKRYSLLQNRQFILFPYQVKNEKATLLPFTEIEKKYPRTAEYIRLNKATLAHRERGKFNDAGWYRFGRSQNLGIQGRAKICVPRLVEHLGVVWDSEGKYFLDNVDVGGVTLRDTNSSITPKYLVAILNSRVMKWYFPKVSTPFRGGWYSANRQYLSPLPIRMLDEKNEQDMANRKKLESLVDQMLATKKQLADSQRDSEGEQLQRKCDYLDAEIDKLVYALYGLTEEEIKIVEGRG